MSDELITPEEALQILIKASERAFMTKKEHDLCEGAGKFLMTFIHQIITGNSDKSKR